jgi:TetR/AcrR family transcriptional regulator, cholesterol catabolism regulator
MRPDKNTKELLLRVAVDLFSQKGYLDTSIRDIATKAGITSSIIYHYFKDKEEMLFEIIKSTTQDLMQSLRETEEKMKDPEECLREMLRAHIVDFKIKRKKESIIVVSDTHLLRNKYRQMMVKMQREIFEIYMKKLNELSERGRLREDIDLLVMNFSIFGTINSFYQWYHERGRLTREEVAQNIITFLLHAITLTESQEKMPSHIYPNYSLQRKGNSHDDKKNN